MWLFDLILDLAALLLWLRAASFRTRPAIRPKTISLLAAIQPPDRLTPSLWTLAGLALLILGRSVVYWKIGAALSWLPTLNFPSVAIPLRSNSFPRMLALSLATFGITLYLFYAFSLLLVSLTQKLENTNSLLCWLRRETGFMSLLPKTSLFLFPWAAGSLFWLISRPAWVSFGLFPKTLTWANLLSESAIFGLNAFLPLQYPLYLLLTFAFLNKSIFFGDSPQVQMLEMASHTLLSPFRIFPLTAFKWDLRPLFLIILVALAQYYGGIYLWRIFRAFLV